MIKYVEGLSTESKSLAFQLPQRHFDGALHREIPVLEPGHFHAAATDGSSIRAAGGRCTIARRIKLALARVHDNWAVVENRAVTIYVHPQEGGASNPRLRSGRTGDRPIASNGFHNSRQQIRGIVDVGQIPDVGRHYAMSNIENGWTAVTLLAEGVLREIITVDRITARGPEHI